MKANYKLSQRLITYILLSLLLQGYPIYANSSEKALPSINYDHQALLEVIDEIPMSLEHKQEATLYLKSIEQKIGEIKRYQSRRHSEHFYHSMKDAILEIRNIASTLYEFVKPYHHTLSNTLRKLILQSIEPLEKELKKRLEMSVVEKEFLRAKTRSLYAEQSYLARQAELQKKLMRHLGKIKQLLNEVGKSSPRCYISYAWPSRENWEEEYWVQPFLSILYDHLTAAGIRMIMDVRDGKTGDSIYKFMEQYKDGNYVILVGTESLLQKHYSITSHVVKTELNIIYNKFEEDQKQYGYSRICPLLISGTINSSFPEIYDKYRTVKEAADLGYVVMLRQLIDWMYEKQIAKVGPAYRNLWNVFDKEFKGLRKEDSKAVEEEINRGYHKQRLDYLRQDHQFQAAQKEQAKPSKST